MPAYYNPDYNPYQGATYTDMAKYLADKSGLEFHVALNWLRAEGSQQHGNPLGYGYTKERGPVTFGNWRQGLDAAVNLLRTSSYYRPIQAAIAGGSPAAERAAIVNSPWSGTTYSHGATFPTAGIPGAGDSRSGSPSAPAPAASGGTAPTLGAWGDQVTFPEGHPLTASDVDSIIKTLNTNGWFGNPNDVTQALAHDVSIAQTRQVLKGAIGQPWNKSLQDQLQNQLFGQASRDNPLALIQGALGGVFTGVAGLAANLAILGVVAALGWSGAKDLLGD